MTQKVSCQEAVLICIDLLKLPPKLWNYTVFSKISLPVQAVSLIGKPICLTPSSDVLKINIDSFQEEKKY